MSVMKLIAMMGDGGASVAFDGVSGYLTVGSDANLALGVAAFTIEMWVYPDVTPAGPVLDGRSDGNGVYPTIGFNGDEPFYLVSGAQRIAGGALDIGAWNHIAVARSGITTRLFLRGTLIGSFVDTINYEQLADRPSIGAQGWALGEALFEGKISNLRIVTGTALYTTGFTPPTAPLTAIGGTQLLTCQGAGFVDASANAYAITPSGGAAVSPASPF